MKNVRRHQEPQLLFANCLVVNKEFILEPPNGGVGINQLVKNRS